MKRIMRAGGTVSYQNRINNNLNLSRALGDFTFKNNKSLGPYDQMVIAVPEIIKIKTSTTKFIIMGCDGIWERKNSVQMIKWIAKKYK